MGKRLIRILSSSIASQLPDLLNKELNLILKNRVALHGKIRRYTDSEIFLEDMVARWHTIHLVDLEEIVFDQASPY